jgi:hypothetical protein
MMAIDGEKRRAEPIPPSKEKHIMNCQNSKRSTS